MVKEMTESQKVAALRAYQNSMLVGNQNPHVSLTEARSSLDNIQLLGGVTIRCGSRDL